MSELDSLAGDYRGIAAKYGDNVKNKVAIVTGSNTGLGFEIAKALAISGCGVVIATRNAEKGNRAVSELATAAGTARQDVPLHFIQCDLASLKSVKNFVSEFKQLHLPLHILVCNAGAWMVPDALSPTEDGFEYQAASFYFGHLYLIERLKGLLKQSAPSRLVWTTSAAESFGSIDWDDIPMVKRTSDFRTYGTAKLYGQMAAREYAAQFKGTGVDVFCAQPGMASTDFFNPDKFSWLRPGAVLQWGLQKLVGLTPAQGAWPIIYVCMAPSTDLRSAEDPDAQYGPEYYDTGLFGLPNITNKGLIRTQPVQNPDLRNDDQCSRLYSATLLLVHSKTPIIGF